jgi:hypothetical protein
MQQNRDAIIHFIENFRGHLTDLDKVLLLLYRKILYAAALDPLARAAFGIADIHRKRIIRLVASEVCRDLLLVLRLHILHCPSAFLRVQVTFDVA